MIINIASFGGRSHLLDIARELAKYGHTVRFYSYVPTKRAVKYGLPKECSYPLLLWAFPFLILFKLFGFKNRIQQIYWRYIDFITAFYMKPCDIFIGQSPTHNFSIRYAKKRYGALTILERGTSHVLEYVKHLKENPSLKGNTIISAYDIRHDMDGYQHCDYISVGAEHVKNSFVAHGIQPEKIFVNNYGFNIDQFHPTQLAPKHYDLIQVSNWSYRKGADLIVDTCRKYGYSFLHVGSIGDTPFPHDIPNFVHVNAVEQYKLQEFYSKAKICIMPSREEGLALVQMQAVACGLPLVCSPYSGGSDIKKYIDIKNYIIELKELTTTELHKCIEEALSIANQQKGLRSYINMEKFQEASWDGYGKRYSDFLKSLK